MTKVFHLMAACTISVVLATSSIAPAQTYTTIDFPGAFATTLNGGPDPGHERRHLHLNSHIAGHSRFYLK